jgi:hypothetical protein
MAPARRWRTASPPLAGALLLGVCAAACGGSPSDGAGPGSAPGTSRAVTPPPDGDTSARLLELRRSGGLAGVDDVVRVDRSGAWTATRREGPVAGRLPPASRTAVLALVDARAWSTQTSGPARSGCPDGFRYTITAAGATVATDDCRLASQPTLAKLVEAVVTGTGI